jgi:hypothetical protein
MCSGTEDTSEIQPETRQPKKVYRVLLGAYLGLGVLLCARNAIAGKLTDKTVALGYFCCVITTLCAWLIIKRFNLLGMELKNPRKTFIWVGSLMAVWVETWFWALEKLLHAKGVAANPNLLIDLLVTMPWYIGMVAVLYSSQKQCRFAWWKLALLGGLYELAADGIVGGMILSDKLGGLQNLWILPLAFPMFVGVYSCMMLPASWLVFGEGGTPEVNEPRERIKLALKPLLVLVVYAVVMFAFLMLVSIGKHK